MNTDQTIPEKLEAQDAKFVAQVFALQTTTELRAILLFGAFAWAYNLALTIY